jgi:phosphoglycerate dehydrogenase-like enzyme
MNGGVVVNSRSEHAAPLVAALERLVPEERFVACAPGEQVPDDADILVTLLDDPSGIAGLLAPQIRWIHMLSTGIDGFPLEAVGDRVVTCSRGATAPAIAEWVLAMMLAFEKRLPSSWVTAPPAQWNVSSLGGLVGRNLGLIGLGAIATEVARRALAFYMKIRALRRRRHADAPPGVALVPSLRDLVAESDHLVVAAPATAQTFHLLDATAFAACKPGVHLVNVSRGTLVDQDALLAALDDGTVARASLDVVEPEPLPVGHPLYVHAAVRLSPHISWSAPGSMAKTFELFIDNLRRYRNREPLHGLVDVAAGY